MRKNDPANPRQQWCTPKDFRRALREYKFQIDVAASASNTVCPLFIDAAKDALHPKTRWFKGGVRRAFCNPGFGNMMPWVQKAHAEVAQAKRPSIVGMIGLCNPSTDWFWWTYHNASCILLLRPRIQFIPPKGVKNSSNSRECVFIEFGTRIVSSTAKVLVWEWQEVDRDVLGTGV